MVGMRVISSPHYSSMTIRSLHPHSQAFYPPLAYWLLPLIFYRRICRRTSYGSTETGWGYWPILCGLCGEIWRRCFASLAVNATPVRNEEPVRNEKLFTSTDDNCIQTAGIRDGASHCVKILDISNSFDSTSRVLTIDVLSGRVSRDFSCGLKRDRHPDPRVPMFVCFISHL